MTSHIRELLASAQAAEIRGDKKKAIELLTKAAAFYRDRRNPARALQMLRQVRRLEGKDPDAFDDEPGMLHLGEVSIGVVGSSAKGPLLGLLDAAGELYEGDDADDRDSLEADLPSDGGDRPEADASSGEDDGLEADPSIGVSAEVPEVALRAPMPEREVTLADPGAELWCSFCCKPQAETGRLVAGPTGSYICSACVQKSLALLLHK